MKITITILMMLFVGTSCARVKILDSEWCGDKGSFGARCTYLKADKRRNLTKVEWDKARTGMICTDARTFTSWKVALKQLCDSHKGCYFYSEEVKETEAALSRVESVVK